MIIGNILNPEEIEFLKLEKTADISVAIAHIQDNLKEIDSATKRIENAPMSYTIEDVTLLINRKKQFIKLLSILTNTENKHKSEILSLVQKLKEMEW